MSDQQSITGAELAALDGAVGEALTARDNSALTVLGFGEISVALGWPSGNPRLVCKRTPPFTPVQFARYEHLVVDYITRLRSHRLDVAETTVMSVDRGGQVVGYLVQPMLPASSLGHNVLASAEPDADHPFLVALAETLTMVSPSLSIDAQVTNFSWDGSRLTLLDVGTPFVWDGDDNLLFEMEPFLRMIPAPTRALVKRDMNKVIARWRDPRGVAVDIVANLYREGLSDWVEPMLMTLNRSLTYDQPVRAGEAKSFYDEDLKTWPRLKRLQSIERWWQTSVRRRQYDFFIHTTFKT